MKFYELFQFPQCTRFAKHVTDIYACIATLFVLLFFFLQPKHWNTVRFAIDSKGVALSTYHRIFEKHITKWWCFVRANQFMSNREMITEFVDIAILCYCLCDKRRVNENTKNCLIQIVPLSWNVSLHHEKLFKLRLWFNQISWSHCNKTTKIAICKL